MPMHDWSNVDPGPFHDFHHSWIEELKRSLNAGVLPSDYYALAQQRTAGFRPDVLTLQSLNSETDAWETVGGTALAIARPRLVPSAESDLGLFRRKQSTIAIRTSDCDRVVAIIEVVSPGNKSSRSAMDAFVRKACELLARGIHLLILDVLPPGPRDPLGIHAALWEYATGTAVTPPEKPLTLVAYEADEATRAYAVPVAVVDPLPDMPLFLWPQACVEVPLESTYTAAVAAFPQRFRRLLEAGTR